uniref:DNA 3'-5' helicase n=1 Tax=Solibacter usitatus (strain Ellin6076) TaxID=234267 RepID=Q027B7_SOLUE
MSAIPFTPDQLDAVDVEKRHLNACVVAGPGSGKTTVLVEYFRRLVEADVDPLRILAITFTEKAAGNMRKKLGQAFQDQPQIRARLERAWVSTVHGFCARLLRENAVFAGVDPEFRVLDATESWRMQQEAMRTAIDSLFADHLEGMRGLIRGLSSFEFEQAVLSSYDTMRGAGTPVDELTHFPVPPGVTVDEINDTLNAIRRESLSGWNHQQKEHLETALEGAERIVGAESPIEALRAIERFSCNLTKCKRGTNTTNLLKRMREQIEGAEYALITALYAPQRELLIEILRRFDRLYRDRKRQGAALDFSDLEEFTVRLLEEHHETRARLQRQFDHILMDEFQDTNGQQAKLIELIRPPDRFYAVGDINQSIFGFRHAEPQGFARYRDEIATGDRHLVQLVDNFRSRAEILSAVETLTAGAKGIEDRALVAGRRFDDAPEHSVEVIAAPETAIEAQWVARRIMELSGPEPQFKDFAVLVRNTEVIPEFTDAFDAAGIPYLVNRGRGFYASREVNDLTHLLRAIANPRDEISLAVVLRSPLVNASVEALLRLKMNGENLGAALQRSEDALLQRFGARLHEWRGRREYVTFDRLLLEAIDDCGYPASGNVDKFLAQARDAASRMSLDEFVMELAQVREENPREPDAPPEDSANAVKIMTVHSAKGLEFPVVFVAAIHKGVDTGVPAVAFSRHYGLGARWRNPASGQDKDDLFQHALRREWKQREEEESNRLFYVAMTRAEQRLILSFTAAARKPQNWDKLVMERLRIEPGTPGDAVKIFEAPDGKQWKARILIAQAAPELLTRERTPNEEITVQFAVPPVVEEQHDSNATVTALALFAGCPRKYYLNRYLGFEGRAARRSEGAALDAGEFGTQVHALLAGTAVASPDPEAVRLAEVFRQSPLGRRAENAVRIEREFDFLLAIADQVIVGQVDLWFEENGELLVVDYKTDTVSASEASHRARDYGLQLRLYALAIERMTGRAPDRGFVHFLRPNVAIEVDLTPSLIESPEQIVRDFQDAQSKLSFPLVEGDHCKRCAYYRDLCPAGGKTD